MQKFLWLVCLLLALSAKTYAQTDSIKGFDARDSIELMKEVMDLLSSSEKPSSYFAASIGIGKRLFNVRNNALNAKQSTINKFIYSPTMGYYHKTGISLSTSANLLNDSITGFGINQYSISPGYQLDENENIYFAFIYTHYFVDNIFSPYTSPLQDDFYASVMYKKTWVQPGLALGYSAGEYGEVKRLDTLYDSVTNNLRVFSFIISASHDFTWDAIFCKKDGLIFNPILMLNAGQSKIGIHHNTNATNLLNFLSKRGRLPKFKSTPFEIGSVGLNLNLLYGIGKFALQPQAYFDYYLQETDERRFTNVFTLNVSYSF
jgi:hypothetical protein